MLEVPFLVLMFIPPPADAAFCFSSVPNNANLPLFFFFR